MISVFFSAVVAICSTHFDKKFFNKKREEYGEFYSPKHSKVLAEDAIPTLHLFWKNENRPPLQSLIDNVSNCNASNVAYPRYFFLFKNY